MKRTFVVAMYVAGLSVLPSPLRAQAASTSPTLSNEQIDSIDEAATVECPAAFTKIGDATMYIQKYAELRKFDVTEANLYITLCKLYAKGFLDGVNRAKKQQ